MKHAGKNSSGARGESILLDNRVLGLSYIGGGVAWLLHLLLAYLVAEFGCIRGWEEVRFLGITLVAWLILVVTLVTLAAAAGATLLSCAIGRQEREPPNVPETGETSGAFTARAAFITNLVFVFVILVETVPIFYYLHDC